MIEKPERKLKKELVNGQAATENTQNEHARKAILCE
jgi:hypothetical protein